jgi:hypothetical protein
MRAIARRLSGGRLAEIPRTIAAALEMILECRVEQVQIIEHAWMLHLHGRAIATTRPGRIYLRGSAADFFASPWLMLHEYCHVVRQWAPRRLTRARYLLESLRRGYWNNRFEVEARAFADRHAAQLLTLIRASDPHYRMTGAPRDPHQRSAPRMASR